MNFLTDVTTFYYTLAFSLGAAAGLSDLFSKYPWTLRRILWTVSGLFYLFFNGIIAVLAYFTANRFGARFGFSAEVEVFRVGLIAIFAMAALRSSVANVRIGNQEVAAGLAAFFEPFTNRTVKEMDRRITDTMIEEVTPLIEGLVYSTSKTYLLAVTMASLRTLSDADKKTLAKGVERIEEKELIDDPTRMLLLAILLVETVGLSLFKTFAKNAKIALLAQNTQAARDAEENLRRLRAAKGLLER